MPRIELVPTRTHRRSRLAWGKTTIGIDCYDVRIDGVTYKQLCGRLRRLRAWLWLRAHTKQP